MSEITCGYCGKIKKCLESVFIEGIKQPQPCQKCNDLMTEGMGLEPEYWIDQLEEIGETESVRLLEAI